MMDKKMMMDKGSSMSEDQIKAKMEVVMELLEKATEMMADGVHSGIEDMMPKAEVSVEASDPADLEEGLDVASELVDGEGDLADIAASAAEMSGPMVSDEDEEEESMFGAKKSPKKKTFGMFSDED